MLNFNFSSLSLSKMHKIARQNGFIIPRNVPTRKQDLLSFIAFEDVMMASTLFVEQKEGGGSRDKRSRIEDAEA